MCFDVLVSRSCVFYFSCFIIKELSFLTDFFDKIGILLNHSLSVVSIDLSVMGWNSVIHGIQWSQWKSLLQVLQCCSFFNSWVHWESPIEQVVENHDRAKKHEESTWSDGEKASTCCFPIFNFLLTLRKHVCEEPYRWYPRELGWPRRTICLLGGNRITLGQQQKIYRFCPIFQTSWRAFRWLMEWWV